VLKETRKGRGERKKSASLIFSKAVQRHFQRERKKRKKKKKRVRVGCRTGIFVFKDSQRLSVLLGNRDDGQGGEKKRGRGEKRKKSYQAWSLCDSSTEYFQ